MALVASNFGKRFPKHGAGSYGEKGGFIQDIKIQGDGFELKLMQEKDKKEISLWAQQLLQRQQGKFVERRLSSEKSFFPDCRIPVWKEET